MTTAFVNWGESRVKLTWEETSLLPANDFITSAHGFCVKENKLLLVNLCDRGWDFPGGHMEPGERPVDCFKREALEEGYVAGDCELLGYITVDHSENPAWTENSRYPKIGYQVFYKMDIKEWLPFEGKHESVQRKLIDPTEVSLYYRNWHVVYQGILDCALR
ncbi:NUDIX hydrolase [Fictibacillus iocasae]|uniref:NUDIX hydrolase n=1 Tax=Fictibacillus iocasae TaxID=2715437 RepID=A0ABW2NLW2_9BACL